MRRIGGDAAALQSAEYRAPGPWLTRTEQNAFARPYAPRPRWAQPNPVDAVLAAAGAPSVALGGGARRGRSPPCTGRCGRQRGYRMELIISRAA